MRSWIALLVCAALTSCASDVERVSAEPGAGGTSVGTGTSTGGSAGQGGDGDALQTCDGLPCPPCEGLAIDTEICAAEPCANVGLCNPVLPEWSCEMSQGTHVSITVPLTCWGGYCVHHVVAESCADGTSCEECEELAKQESCFGATSYAKAAACCEAKYWMPSFTPIYAPCVCAPSGACADLCATSVLCGGPGPDTDECGKCVADAVRPGGACLTNDAFQDACMGGDPSCWKLAQCFAQTGIG